MLTFKIEQEVNPDNYSDPTEKRLVALFNCYKDIVKLGKKLSRLKDMVALEQRFIDNCRYYNYGWLMGNPVLVWDIPTGKYLMKIKMPELTQEKFSAEITKWKHS